jgi:hypothetical protein
VDWLLVIGYESIDSLVIRNDQLANINDSLKEQALLSGKENIF